MLLKVRNALFIWSIVLIVNSAFSQNVANPIDTSYVYDLPYEIGLKVYVLQGYNGSYSHKGQYALDFRLRKGNSVLAAREGIVSNVEDNNSKGGPFKKYSNKGNYVIIMHDDGTYAAYWHLSHKKVFVKKGDAVLKGQLIGLSGNTGYSSSAHLHFDVYYMKNNVKLTIPTKFQTSKGVQLLRVYHKYCKPVK
jgi:murein DD-endopeptidase MepM/ murein hydrolase activator NlpD